MDATVIVNRAAVVYTNAELLPWIKPILAAGRKKSKRKSDPSESSDWLAAIRRIPLTLTVEAWDLSAVALFQDALALRSGMTHFQLQLVDHPATGASSCELQGETLWCCLGNRTPSDPAGTLGKKVHYWGSPLYIGLIIGKIERRLSVLGMPGSVQSQLMLDVIRFEWSPALVDTIVTIKK